VPLSGRRCSRALGQSYIKCSKFGNETVRILPKFQGAKIIPFRFCNDTISAVNSIKSESDLATVYLGDEPAVKDL
jgi:hypothetical protein